MPYQSATYPAQGQSGVVHQISLGRRPGYGVHPRRGRRVDRGGQEPPAAPSSQSLRSGAKKNETRQGVMAGWNALFDQARAAFAQHRSFERARTFGVSALTCLGRRTLSGLLCASGQQFRDWSAAYRLFERQRLDGEALWRVPLRGVLETLPPASPIVALIDDTLIRKRGHRIAGTSWRPDPLGPHFADNFIWATRFLQLSLALPEHPQPPTTPPPPTPLHRLT